MKKSVAVLGAITVVILGIATFGYLDARYEFSAAGGDLKNGISAPAGDGVECSSPFISQDGTKFVTLCNRSGKYTGKYVKRFACFDSQSGVVWQKFSFGTPQANDNADFDRCAAIALPKMGKESQALAGKIFDSSKKDKDQSVFSYSSGAISFTTKVIERDVPMQGAGNGETAKAKVWDYKLSNSGAAFLTGSALYVTASVADNGRVIVETKNDEGKQSGPVDQNVSLCQGGNGELSADGKTASCKRCDKTGCDWRVYKLGDSSYSVQQFSSPGAMPNGKMQIFQGGNFSFLNGKTYLNGVLADMPEDASSTVMDRELSKFVVYYGRYAPGAKSFPTPTWPKNRARPYPIHEQAVATGTGETTVTGSTLP